MMNASAREKKIMEILNLVVGFELIGVGLIYLLRSDWSSAASWSIFGCMYIVMDKYTLLTDMTGRRKFVEAIKYGAAWLGFVITTVFLGYLGLGN